ncbi:MAG: hypothetical protein K0R61_2711 [Microvirga sp.]|nr:hypothetical protein [Microvirga sp.]
MLNIVLLEEVTIGAAAGVGTTWLSFEERSSLRNGSQKTVLKC